jgi:hypothetical protein
MLQHTPQVGPWQWPACQEVPEQLLQLDVRPKLLSVTSLIARLLPSEEVTSLCKACEVNMHTWPPMKAKACMVYPVLGDMRGCVDP